MASIDKTYTESYEEYKAFKDWADKEFITFFDGHKECIGDRVWNYEKSDFDCGEIPIMNTQSWMDAYLIKNCKSDFVLDRMRDVHTLDFHNHAKKVNFSTLPDKYQQNRKISIKREVGITCFKKHESPYGGGVWLIQCNHNLWFNSETKIWCHRDVFYPTNTNTSHAKSLKGVIRHLRKQYLPKGIEFRIIGKYIGESYILSVR